MTLGRDASFFTIGVRHAALDAGFSTKKHLFRSHVEDQLEEHHVFLLQAPKSLLLFRSTGIQPLQLTPSRAGELQNHFPGPVFPLQFQDLLSAGTRKSAP